MNTNKIYLTLRKLMEMKSARDGVNFTLYRLAKSLQMPHSVLLRLIHLEPNKRVTNPRVDTLYKIVKFFKLDGFNITINDLLNGLNDEAEITNQNQALFAFNHETELPLYSFNTAKLAKIGHIQIKLAIQANNLMAFLSEEEIKPILKKGSIFIINPNASLTNNSLVAVKIKKDDQILIRECHIEADKTLLKIDDSTLPPLVLNPQLHSILGAVTQVHVKTY